MGAVESRLTPGDDGVYDAHDAHGTHSSPSTSSYDPQSRRRTLRYDDVPSDALANGNSGGTFFSSPGMSKTKGTIKTISRSLLTYLRIAAIKGGIPLADELDPRLNTHTKDVSRSGESYLSKVASLHEKVLAFQYECFDKASTSAPGFDHPGYLQSISEAAVVLNEQHNNVHPNSAMTIVLTPTEVPSYVSIFSQFGEKDGRLKLIKCQWEWPRTSEVLPLDVILKVCRLMYDWLESGVSTQNKVVCLHTCGGYGSGTASVLRFLCACYLLYSGEQNSVTDAINAVSSAPPAFVKKRLEHDTGTDMKGDEENDVLRKGFSYISSGSLRAVSTRNSANASVSIATAAQRQYAQWILEIIKSGKKHRSPPKCVPKTQRDVTARVTTVSLSHALGFDSKPKQRAVVAPNSGVVLEREIKGLIHKPGFRPYVLIHCRGELAGASFSLDGTKPERFEVGDENVELTLHSVVSQEGDTGALVTNDVTVSLYHWSGDKSTDEISPFAVFAFHTGCFGNGVSTCVRVTKSELDGVLRERLPESFVVSVDLETVQGVCANSVSSTSDDETAASSQIASSSVASSDDDEFYDTINSLPQSPKSPHTPRDAVQRWLWEDTERIKRMTRGPEAFSVGGFITARTTFVEKGHSSVDTKIPQPTPVVPLKSTQPEQPDHPEYEAKKTLLQQRADRAARVLQSIGVAEVSHEKINNATARMRMREIDSFHGVGRTEETPDRNESMPRQPTLEPPAVPESVGKGVRVPPQPPPRLIGTIPAPPPPPVRIAGTPPRPPCPPVRIGANPPPPPPPPPGGVRAPPPPPPPGGFRHAATRAASNAFRKVFWDKVPSTTGTWWEELRNTTALEGMSRDGPVESGTMPDNKPDNTELDFSLPSLSPAHTVALRLAFTNSKPKTQVKDGKGGPSTSTSTVRKNQPSLVSIQRANNVSIALARLKVFEFYEDGNKNKITPSHDLLVRAVSSGNFHGLLTQENLLSLLVACPAGEEIELIETKRKADPKWQDTLDTLTSPERFLVKASGVSRIREKLEAAMFMTEFDELLTDVACALDAVKTACAEIHDSKQLKLVLKYALAAGNALNEGTTRGNASGFTFDSLHKFNDVRSVGKGEVSSNESSPGNPRTTALGTLLDFIVALVDEERGSGDLGDNGDELKTQPKPLSMSDELKTSGEARKWSRADLASALAKVELGVRRVANEAEKAQKEAEAMYTSMDEALSTQDVDNITAEKRRNIVDLTRCAEIFSNFVDQTENKRKALGALAGYVDDKYKQLCVYIGEGGGSNKSGNGGTKQDSSDAPPRDPEEVFGGVWAFAKQVDNSRERRLALIAQAEAIQKRKQIRLEMSRQIE